jgi:hypothetical protein
MARCIPSRLSDGFFIVLALVNLLKNVGQLTRNSSACLMGEIDKERLSSFAPSFREAAMQ